MLNTPTNSYYYDDGINFQQVTENSPPHCGYNDNIVTTSLLDINPDHLLYIPDILAEA